MLTKNDLNQIGEVVDKRLDVALEPINTELRGIKSRLKGVEGKLNQVNETLKDTRRIVRKTDKTLHEFVDHFDRRLTKVERKTKVIENHLSL